MNKTKSLTIAHLKNIALILMFINHFFVIYSNYFPLYGIIYNLQSFITRPSFILFAFLLSEGMCHTKNRNKYMLRLLILAFISEPIYDKAFYGSWFYVLDQNVLFDLFMGAVAICIYDNFHDSKLKLVIALGLLIVIDMFLNFSYNYVAIGVILGFYILKENRNKNIIMFILIITLSIARYIKLYLTDVLLLNESLFYAAEASCRVFALPFIRRYNGEKGKQLPKYFYYLFYPVHIALIYLVLNFVGNIELF